MDVVVLVPRRADNGPRDRLWEFCRELWQQRHPWPIFEGAHDEGPFNRSAAINRAALDAGDFDVALIIDADVICAPSSVETAVAVAHSHDRLVVAHDERVMLNRKGTERVLDGYDGSWRHPSMVERVWYDSVSCAVAVSHDLWDLAGPFDESFVGWGREDTGFRISCEAETGPILKVCGETFHLWHPPAPDAARSHPLRKENERRHQAYVAARGNRTQVRALREQHSVVSVETAREPSDEHLRQSSGQPEHVSRIPRVLHRTVPAETSEQVELWWQQFEQMHPTWQLRTYREPIDPADWPLTGDLFDSCQNGAQKAGLIRLEALCTHGGVYVDSDVEPVRPLDALLALSAFAAWEDERIVPDAVLGATAHHPAFEIMLDKARSVIEGGGDAHQSGPSVSTETLPHRDDVLVLPPGAFYEVHYLNKRRLNDPHPPWAFVRHHWHHSWGTDSQRRAIARRQR